MLTSDGNAQPTLQDTFCQACKKAGKDNDCASCNKSVTVHKD